MRRLVALLLAVAGVTFAAPEPVSAHGCSAWVSDTRTAIGYCSASSGHTARLGAACRTGTSLWTKYVYYYTWLSNGGVQVVYCPYGWYASSAFMQVR